MITSRIFATTTVALSVLAAAGCTSPQTSPYAAATPAPMVAPMATPMTTAAEPSPAPVMRAEVMQAQPVPGATAGAMNNDRPVVMASNPPIDTAPAMTTERAPRADRN